MTNLEKHYLYSMYKVLMDLLQSDLYEEVIESLDEHGVRLAIIYEYIEKH